MLAYYGIGLLALRQGDLPRALPCSNGLWASVRKRPSRSIPLDGCGLGCGVRSGRAHRRRHTAAHASDGAERLQRRRAAIQALCRLSLGEALCQPAAWRRRRLLPSARWCLRVTRQERGTRPMPCASSATLRRGANLRSTITPEITTARPSPWPRHWACARSGPLPPRPRDALCQDRTPR